MMELFNRTAFECSKVITQNYSTSFTLGIKTLARKFHMPIYAIYGFVRYADEIVDTFYQFDKEELLRRFKEDAYRAIAERVSLNPILHAFQSVVHAYSIEMPLIEAFLHSMALDLHENAYNQTGYEEYIYGSAEVVGLMCLRVFCEGDDARYQSLKASAKRLGAAFQKVNFLRDMKSDFWERGRVYFPYIDFNRFDQNAKIRIEEDIAEDFKAAYEGIVALPRSARLGVYLAYTYYLKLFNKIKRLPPQTILRQRVRVPDSRKMTLWLQSYLMFKLCYI